MEPERQDLGARIAAAFARERFDLYLVGGALRDELLGRAHDDLDFATNARPEETANLLATLPDVSIYRVGEKFGTIGAVRGNRTVEITTYRSAEVYAENSRKPKVEFGRTIEEDLSRRDFTVNAMARNTTPAESTDELIDPFGGLNDLQNRIIRAVGRPDERFREDPLRILRAIRFATTLDFEIEPDTWTSIRKSAPLLPRIARERIAEEFNRMLTGPGPTRAFTLMRDSGILENTVPELLDLDRIPDQGPYHRYSLWDHTFRVVEGAPPDLVTRWAALLHDIAKPETMTRDADGRIRFFGHEDLGAEKTVRILRSLNLGNDFISSVRNLVDTHMQLHQYTSEWSEGAVRRLRWKLGDDFDRAISLSEADARGHGDNPWSRSGAQDLARRARELTIELPEPSSPLDGAELMEHYGRGPGPWVGTIKQALTELVTEGKLQADDKAGAWSAADRLEAATRGSATA